MRKSEPKRLNIYVNRILICMILTRYINTKLLKSCSECQKLLKVAKKLLKTPKGAQKLPNTICSGLVEYRESFVF